MADGLPKVSARPRRSPVFLTASLETGGSAVDVRLRNISKDGALVDSDFLPQVGSAVVFRRQEIVAQGVIAWVNGRLAGIQFDQPLEPAELLRHIPRPPPVAEIPSQSFRRPGLRSHCLSPTERAWVERWMGAPAIDHPGE